MPTLFLSFLALAIWLYLIVGRGGFWLSSVRDQGAFAPPNTWPTVAIIIPARDEAEGIAASVGSLLAQDYAGPLRIILVDDGSTDGTAAIATRTATEASREQALEVITGEPLPAGWTGKLWALKQGIDRAQAGGANYYLLSDADIVYAPDVLGGLVARAQAGGLVLTSLMVKLRCESLPERALIPAFIFFFQMLFPFAWVNRPDRRIAAAAGGCMLVRIQDLRQAGGIESIRDALIDDCALAARLKTRGPIRLELTERVVSLRPYPSLGEIRRMVARSAYAQLRYSPLLLLGTIAGMALIYVAPPALALFAEGAARGLGILGWLAMALAFQPTLRFYRLSPLWGLALPAIAAIYLLFTLDSAYQHGRGRGGMWKGRAQAPGSGAA
jgi:hopene-associated glycosyltransferase HpnB